jgi:hypothetical protein
MKFLSWMRDRISATWLFWLWFFGIENIRTGDLSTILELRAEIIELRSENLDLRNSRDALDAAMFEGYKVDGDRHLNELMAQFGMFFSNAGFNRFQTEEFLFFRKISMQFMSLSYQLGEKHGDRSKATNEGEATGAK